MFKYKEYNLISTVCQYVTHPVTALVLETDEGEPYATVSTNLEEVSVLHGRNFIWVPLYKVGHLLPAMLKEGILIDPERPNYYQGYGEFKLFEINFKKVDQFIDVTYDEENNTLIDGESPLEEGEYEE